MEEAYTQFFCADDRIYTVTFDNSEFHIFYIHGNTIEQKSVITITYPTCEVTLTEPNEVLTAVKANLDTAHFGLQADTLDSSDAVYAQLDPAVREAFVKRQYTTVDLDNDGEKELYIRWDMSSSRKMMTTLYGDGYAIFKKTNGQYHLYDSNKNAASGETMIYTFLNTDTLCSNHVNFYTYNGKTYTLSLEESYASSDDFDRRLTGTVSVYEINRNEVRKIGTLNLRYQPKIEIAKGT